MSTLAEQLAVTRAVRGDEPAVEVEGAWLSWRDLDHLAQRTAAGLAALGVGIGDRVAIGFPNGRELLASLLGTLHRGAIAVPVNPASTPGEVEHILTDAEVSVALLHDELAAAMRESTRPARRVFRQPPVAHGTPPAVGSDARETALLVYTSGTTGRPKGARLSHQALLTNLRTVAAAWEWTAADRLLLTLPCFHLHGLGLGLLTSFLVGSSVVLRPRFDLGAILPDLAQHRATMFFGVPTMYARLVTLPPDTFRAHDLSRMRMWVSGSAPLPAALGEVFRARTGHALMDRYGMTECGFVLSTSPAEARHPGLVGRPLPGVEVRLVDTEAADRGRIEDVADGEAGEILVRGPNLFSGYWNRPQETAAMFLDGYLRSGDVARREEDGQFRILGRRSVDILKSRGFKVSAIEIEDALQSFPGLVEVAVVGLPDPDQGERIVAVCTTADDQPLDEKGLVAHARRHLAPHKVPSRFVRMTEIPRIGPGKFRKRELIEQLQVDPSSSQEPFTKAATRTGSAFPESKS